MCFHRGHCQSEDNFVEVALVFSVSSNMGSRGGTQIVRLLKQVRLPDEPSFWPGPAVTARGNGTNYRTGHR